MLQMILQNTKIDMLPPKALIIFPSALIFRLLLIWVHGGLLPLLQQFAHVMILDWKERGRHNGHSHTFEKNHDISFESTCERPTDDTVACWASWRWFIPQSQPSPRELVRVLFSRQKYRTGSDAWQRVCKVMSEWVVFVHRRFSRARACYDLGGGVAQHIVGEGYALENV